MTALRRAVTTPWSAALVLLVAYVLLGLTTDSGGYLGTDTGGKVATLEAMTDRGTFDPDLGYWAAEQDPDGVLHPLAYTLHVGDRYVNVTTLPMVLAGRPLYAAAGYRGAVLLAMASAVLVALAARALAGRLGGSEATGWAAYWLVGLASPVAVYALDFWEHAPGLAAMAWALVFLVDVVDGRAGWRAGGVAGLLFGLAASMRTEALLYGAVFVAAALLVMLLRTRSLARPFLAGTAALAGVLVTMVLNDRVERLVLDGDPLRATRTVDAAGAAGADLTDRVREGMLTTAGVTATAGWAPIVGGALVAALIVAALVLSRRPDRARVAVVCGAVAPVLLFAALLSDGLGFVPGFLVASPVAVVGVWAAASKSSPHRWLAVAAVAALPLVWLFQFSGGAGPQWGGRYVLASSFVLAVFGAVALPALPRPTGRWIAAVALAVTAAGVVWLSVRSHQVDEAFERLAARPEEVLISRTFFFLREGGAVAADGRHWLSVRTREELDQAVAIVDDLGLDRFVMIGVDDFPPPTVDGWTTEPRTTIPLFAGDPIAVDVYVRE